MADLEEREDKYTRRVRRRRRMLLHGKSLARIYRDAVRKRGSREEA